MGDIAFSDYHKFGSKSRVLPGFEVIQDEKPQGNSASPKTPVSIRYSSLLKSKSRPPLNRVEVP